MLDVHEHAYGDDRMVHQAFTLFAKQRELRQHPPFLAHFLDIDDGLFLDAFDCVLDLFFTGEDDRRIAAIIRNAVMVLQPCQIRIKTRFSQVCTQRTHVLFQRFPQRIPRQLIELLLLSAQCAAKLFFHFIQLRVGQQDVAGRNDAHLADLADGPLCSDIEQTDAVDDVVKEFDAHRIFAVHGIHIDDAAARRIAQRLIDTAHPGVSGFL